MLKPRQEILGKHPILQQQNTKGLHNAPVHRDRFYTNPGNHPSFTSGFHTKHEGIQNIRFLKYLHPWSNKLTCIEL